MDFDRIREECIYKDSGELVRESMNSFINAQPERICMGFGERGFWGRPNKQYAFVRSNAILAVLIGSPFFGVTAKLSTNY